jgi:hypothetical protein
MEGERQEIVNEARHRGPNLGAVSAVYTVLFLSSLVVTAIMTKGSHFPSPFIAPDLAQAFFAGNRGAVGIGAFLQFGATVPLGIFTATVVSRLQFLGVNVAGVFIALLGGFTAALSATISALLQWVLAQPGSRHNPSLHAFFICLASQPVEWDSSCRWACLWQECPSLPGLQRYFRDGWYGWGLL